MKIKILLLFLLIPLTGYANLGDSRVEAISRYGPEVAIKYLPGLFAYTGNKRYAILQFYDSESERAIAVAYIKRENAPLGEVVPFTQEEWHELQQLNLPTAEFPAEPSTTEPSRLSSKYLRKFWISTDAKWGMYNAPAAPTTDPAHYHLNDMLIFGTLEGMYVVVYNMRHLGKAPEQ